MRVVAIGEEVRVLGLALAGVDLVPAETASDVLSAWDALPDDVGVVVLTPLAAEALADHPEPGRRLRAVMPG